MDDLMISEMRQLVAVQQDGAAQTMQMVAQMRELMLGLTQRIESLERTMSLRVTVSQEQYRALMRAVRSRADELSDRHGITDRKSVNALRRAVKSETLAEYGIRDFHDLPAAHMDSALKAISEWTSFRLIRKLKGGAAQ